MITLAHLREICLDSREDTVAELIDTLHESTEFDRGFRAGKIVAYEMIMEELRHYLKHHECVMDGVRCVYCGFGNANILTTE